MPDTPGPGGPAPDGEYLGDVMRRRLGRRAALKGAAAAGVGLVTTGSVIGSAIGLVRAGPPAGLTTSAHVTSRRQARRSSALAFAPIAPSTADEVIVPAGYSHRVVLSWGDPLFPGAPALDLDHQTRQTQEQQFGFNCDFIGFFPLGTNAAALCVNHEYTSGSDMFPGYDRSAPTGDQVGAEIAAHGMSVVEIRRHTGGGWRFQLDSPLNRRITGFTPIEISGPLRGHPLMRTERDPTGVRVEGMLNNCAGGKTPWGTVLTCEENFDQYFANYSSSPHSDRIRARSGSSSRKWERFDDRFDLSRHPNEYHRFGYVVEIDPTDPDFVPRKRTALGRFKHECAVTAVARDRRVAVYSGDDARFEYVYKFITTGTMGPRRSDNLNLLDQGTLHVARFDADGTGRWIPLPGDPESILNTRGRADAAGATRMDRPEDIGVSPTSGKVYIALTNNTRRSTISDDPGEVAANPRLDNEWGHIIEITEDHGDAASLIFTWEIFMLCGDPARQGGITDLADLADDVGQVGADTPDATYFGGFDPSQVSPIAAPDNIAFDQRGNLWVATDGQPGKPFFGQNDGVFAISTDGPERGRCRQFLSGVPGGEVCGPEFSDDDRTFFCGIQHPGAGGGLPNSISSWPAGNRPAKPSIISVWNDDGDRIGQ